VPTEPENKTPFLSNVAFSALAWAIPLLLSFVATSALIKGLGVEKYGLYTLVLAVISFGFTTGIGKVVAKYIPEYRSENDPDSLSTVLSTTMVLTVGAGLIEAVFLALLAPVLASRWLNVPIESQRELTIALWIVCLIGPVTMISQVFQSAAQGLHRFRAFTILTVIAAIGVSLGSIALVILGYNYPVIILWNLLIAICSVLRVLSLYMAETAGAPSEAEHRPTDALKGRTIRHNYRRLSGDNERSFRIRANVCGQEFWFGNAFVLCGAPNARDLFACIDRKLRAGR
jgi:O-antigen/teichoic acid export membrane protein